MENNLALSHKEFLKVDRDHEMAATVAHLVYVTDALPGIRRVRKGKGYAYFFGDKLIRDRDGIRRIRKLVIPPSWTKVWICSDAKGHIQATGLDLRGRKQYRYHALWNELRAETKFHRLYEFGRALPGIRARVEEDLRRKELCQDKILAAVICLMERTYIRIGNPEYEKANGSYGLTTMKNRHVSIDGDKLAFSFVGKKGVRHKITLRNKRLARIVRQCLDIPGKELFQYYGDEGEPRPIDSGMVNEYIRAAMHQDFSAKDFRTWAGSIHALAAFRTIGAAATAADQKRNLAAMLDAVSIKLGNTPAVCRKYYIHPAVIRGYEEGLLSQYLDGEVSGEKPEDGQASQAEQLTGEEKVLMKILGRYIR